MVTKDLFIQLVRNKISEREQNIGRRISKEEQLFILREQIQLDILDKLYSSGIFKNVFFMLGTNLRICYGLPRYSEDMDFTILNENEIPNTEMVNKTLSELLDCLNGEEPIWKTNFNILKTNIIFKGIAYECGIKDVNKNEKLDIKFEIDTKPSKGADYEKTIIYDGEKPIKIIHHKIETTFAGKLSALLMRKYAKGRDYFDVYWYLSKKPRIPFSLEYVNGNIRRYNEINKNSEGFIQLHEFKDHKSVLEEIGAKIINLKANEISRIQDDIKRFIFWESDKIEIFSDNIFNNINNEIIEYYDIIKSSLNKINNKNEFKL